MNYLLNTHAILWFLNGDQMRLSNSSKEIITDQQSIKFVSMASVWEVGIKINIGKLSFPQNTSGFVRQIQQNGFELLPISTNHIVAMEMLPLIHRDPFDRLLIAAAISEQMTIITKDDNIVRYNVSHVW